MKLSREYFAALKRHRSSFMRRDIVLASAPRMLHVQRLSDQYALYLQKERGLAPLTLQLFAHHSCLSDEAVWGRSLQLSQLCAAKVILFVRPQVGRAFPKAAKLAITALRSFPR